jgi:hypothetical protein
MGFENTVVVGFVRRWLEYGGQNASSPPPVTREP